MNEFFDLHCHILPGVDDGAEDEECAIEMLKMAYDDGIRSICFTPHRNPYVRQWADIPVKDVFEQFTSRAAQLFPTIRFALGSEIMYYEDCTDDIRRGRCMSLCGGRNVLVEFPGTVSFDDLSRGVGRILSVGYRPVLAHAERYDCLLKHPSRLITLTEEDCLIQLDASLFIRRQTGDLIHRYRAKRLLRRLYTENVPFVVATDAHNTDTRKPVLSHAFRAVEKAMGSAFAQQVFFDLPGAIFNGQDV